MNNYRDNNSVETRKERFFKKSFNTVRARRKFI